MGREVEGSVVEPFFHAVVNAHAPKLPAPGGVPYAKPLTTPCVYTLEDREYERETQEGTKECVNRDRLHGMFVVQIKLRGKKTQIVTRFVERSLKNDTPNQKKDHAPNPTHAVRPMTKLATPIVVEERAPGMVLPPALMLPLLLLPNTAFPPFPPPACPFPDWIAPTSTVAEPTLTIDVAKVAVVAVSSEVDEARDWSVRKTMAIEGALSGMEQVLAPVSQLMVTVSLSPYSLPSLANDVRRVWLAQ